MFAGGVSARWRVCCCLTSTTLLLYAVIGASPPRAAEQLPTSPIGGGDGRCHSGARRPREDSNLRPSD
jgi:hypothetical protein